MHWTVQEHLGIDATVRGRLNAQLCLYAISAVKVYPQCLRLRQYFLSALPRLLYIYEQALLRLTQLHLVFPISFSALTPPLRQAANPPAQRLPVAAPSRSGFLVGR